jgi:hypothetical protein
MSKVISLLLISFFLFSCGSHRFSKRKYTKGFYKEKRFHQKSYKKRDRLTITVKSSDLDSNRNQNKHKSNHHSELIVRTENESITCVGDDLIQIKDNEPQFVEENIKKEENSFYSNSIGDMAEHSSENENNKTMSIAGILGLVGLICSILVFIFFIVVVIGSSLLFFYIGIAFALAAIVLGIVSLALINKKKKSNPNYRDDKAKKMSWVAITLPFVAFFVLGISYLVLMIVGLI